MKEITKKSLVAIGIMIASLVFISFLVSRQDRTEETTKRTNTTTDTATETRAVQQQEPSYTLSASQLENDYKANGVAADIKYKGHIVVVSGTIDSISKDIGDNAYIIIKGENSSWGVQCFFTKSEEQAIAQLSKGQYITVKGRVDRGSPWVWLRECTLQ